MKKFLFLFGIYSYIFACNSTDVAIAIDGNYLKVWNVVYKDFLTIKDLSISQKDLKHYKIHFKVEEKYYIILFHGKLMNEANIQKYHRMIYGREMKYIINKKDFSIIDRVFFK